MRSCFLLVTSLLTIFSAVGFITLDDPIKQIVEKLEKFRTQYPQEKVHLHLDKPYYAVGDDVWFKVYVVNAQDNKLSDISEIVYVELIDGDDSIEQSLRLSLTNGVAFGDFKLGDSLREGNYRIRAYTTWMRNFNEDFFFDKTITIGNGTSTNYLTDVTYSYNEVGNNQKVTANIRYTNLNGEPVSDKDVTYTVELGFRSIAKGKATTDHDGRVEISFVNNQPWLVKSGKLNTYIKVSDKEAVVKSFPVKSTSDEVTVQFFPEGGDLVNGIRSKVAFKATGGDGLGRNVKGSIFDENGKSVADLVSKHAGMGIFYFTPDAQHSYKARVKYEDGSEKTFALPQALEAGYVLSANNVDPDSLNVQILISPSLTGKGEITLVAHTNGLISYVSKNKIEGKMLKAAIPKSRFQTGILHLTLFSSANDPVAERLIFIDNTDNLNITVNSNAAEYGKREKTELSIDVKNGAGKPVAGNFSVSVIDESKVPFNDDDESTILSNLLLTSDIKGYVEKPNFYFSKPSEEKVKALDNLLLTQGWRRFTWKNILADVYPPVKFEPETDISISGEVTDVRGRAVAGGKVTLLSSAGDVFALDTLTDSSGRFSFDDLMFKDSTKFVIQARNAKNRKNVEIVLDRLPPQLVTKNKNWPEVEVNINKSIANYLKNSRNQFDELRRYRLSTRSILLSEVKVIEKKPSVQHSANLNGAGSADAVLNADQLENCLSLDQCIQGRVAGVLVRNGVAYSSRSMYSSFSGLVPMQLILDGMYVEPTFLSLINPRDVETIEVLKSASNTAIYGIRGGGGVLIITTKRGRENVGYSTYAMGVATYMPKGIHKAREFYAPHYGEINSNAKMTDFRTTIYWNPEIITNDLKPAHVSYFNADGVGTYKVIVEGITENGDIGRAIYRYNVK